MRTIFHRNKRRLKRPYFICVRRLVREHDYGLPYRYLHCDSRWGRELHEREERNASLTWLGMHGKTVYRINVIPKAPLCAD
jgi:hypothetical protein